MKLLFSAFTGYNLRELLLPLSPLLDRDQSISDVFVVTPAADNAQELLPDLKNKYHFLPEVHDAPAYEKILATHRPALVVTPTAGLEPRDIPLIQAAKSLGIPTLTFIASWDNVYKMERRMRLKKYQGQYALADYFAVWNAVNRDHLLRIAPQLTPERVTITGAPRLDYVANPENLPSRAAVCESLRIPNDDGQLIHLATTELYSSDYLVRALAAARGRQLPKNFHLLVSVHPGGNLATHQAYAQGSSIYVRYSFGRYESSLIPDFRYRPTLENMRLHAGLFYHSNLLMNHSSTVTIESILADRPVINVKYGRPFDWLNWHRSMVYRDFKQHAKIIIDSDATTIAKSRRSLVAATARYLAHTEHHRPARANLARTMVTFTDGTAGQRLLDLIKKIAHGSHSL